LKQFLDALRNGSGIVGKLDALLILLSTASIFGVFAYQLPVMLANDDGAYYANMILNLRPGWMDGKPAYIWIGYVIFKVASFFDASRPNLVLAFGLYSALFGSLTAANLYFISKSLFNQKYLGIAAGLLAAFSPIGFTMSLLVAPYPLTLFFSTLAVAAWTRKNYLVWSVGWALAMCSHASSVLLAVTWLASLLASRDRKVTTTVVKCLSVTVAVCLVFFGWVLLFYPSLEYFIRFNLWVSAKDYLLPVTSNWLAERADALAQSNGSLLLIMSAIGAFLVLKRRLPSQLILIWWVIPYLAFYLVWGQAGGKFYIFLVPAVALMSASAIGEIAENLGAALAGFRANLGSFPMKRLWSVTIAVVLITLTLVAGLLQGYGTVTQMKTNPNEFSTLGMEINDWATQENLSSKAVIIAGWETNYIIFYSPGVKVLGWYGSVFPSNSADITALVLINIFREQARHQRVFVTRIWYVQDASHDQRVAFAASVIASHFRVIRTNDMLFEVV
jgi:hypothetical protein